MEIKASELEKEVRERYLIQENETLVVKEIERGKGTGLRRFMLYDTKGKLRGTFYEDLLPERIL